MKKFVMGLIVGVAITAAGSVYADEGLQKIEAYLRPTLPVMLDGTPLKLESPPVMVDGSTYLKLRDVAAATGLGVNWNDTTQTVELNSEGVKKVEETTSHQSSPTSGPPQATITKEEIPSKIDYYKNQIWLANVNISSFEDNIKNNPSDQDDKYKKTIEELKIKITDYEAQIAALEAQK